MRGNHRKRATLAILLALTTVLPATACSGGSATGKGPSDKPVTLRFTWWGGDDRQKRTQQVISLFEKAHPKITVKGEFKDWNGYWDSLSTTVAARDAPDVIQMDELYIASYAQRGALLDLGTTKKYLDTGDFDQKALATGTVAGKQYGLPVGLTAYSVVVNADLLQRYGIPLPDDNTWSWDDLRRIGAQVSKASGGKVTGVQSWGFDAGGLNIWARQAGASLYGDKGNVVIPQSVLASYWSYLAGLAKSGVAPPPSVTVERAKAGLAQSGTATNTSVFGTWWNTQLTALTAASGAKLKLLKLPGESGASTPAAYYKPSMYWSISSGTKHPAEAAMFVDFLANSQDAANVLLTERGVPANTKIRAGIAGSLTETDKAAVAYLDTIKVSDPPRVTPKGASTIEAILGRHTEDVLFGRATPEQAAKAFITELQGEINSA
jgi:multiple sugar transport system substrate-binding protein